jgi:prepilin peptidase CpaA
MILVAVLAAAVTDLWKFKIPNWLTLPLLLSGLIYQAFTGGTPGLAGSLAGVLLGFAVLLPFFLMGGMGAGDVKLMAAVGAWAGAPFTFGLFLISSLFTGVYASFLIVLAMTRRQDGIHAPGATLPTLPAEGNVALDRVEAEVRSPGRRRRVIPFAAMMAAGMIVIVVWLWAAPPPGP